MRKDPKGPDAIIEEHLTRINVGAETLADIDTSAMAGDDLTIATKVNDLLTILRTCNILKEEE